MVALRLQLLVAGRAKTTTTMMTTQWWRHCYRSTWLSRIWLSTRYFCLIFRLSCPDLSAMLKRLSTLVSKLNVRIVGALICRARGPGHGHQILDWVMISPANFDPACELRARVGLHKIWLRGPQCFETVLTSQYLLPPCSKNILAWRPYIYSSIDAVCWN